MVPEERKREITEFLDRIHAEAHERGLQLVVCANEYEDMDGVPHLAYGRVLVHHCDSRVPDDDEETLGRLHAAVAAQSAAYILTWASGVLLPDEGLRVVPPPEPS